MMLKPASPIQAPRPELLHELARHLANDAVEDGSPMVRWDEIRGVFLVVIPIAGQVVHWTLEPCGDEATAAMLTQRCVDDFAANVYGEERRRTQEEVQEEVRAAFRGQDPTEGR